MENEAGTDQLTSSCLGAGDQELFMYLMNKSSWQQVCLQSGDYDSSNSKMGLKLKKRRLQQLKTV